MKYIYLVLFTAIFSCNGQEKNNDFKSNSKISLLAKGNENEIKRKQELNYIKRRNSNIAYFEEKEYNDRTYKQVNDSLLALEKLLQHILIPTRVQEINETGKINLETFLPELGFGMLDALTVYEKEISILCTTNFIFSDYFKGQGYNFNNITENKIEDIFSYAFASDYVITGIHSYKINQTENIQAYGMISIDGQDIGPFKPNSLYALVIIEDNMYLISKSIKKELEGIEKCERIWNNVDSESEDKTWENYCECYQREFTNNEQLLPLKKEIEKMVNLIIE
ncbi:hypothetical protein [Cellulophaga sp. E6(2014)]|uniref:hypothetical protein n=1 Tax=Cellulophaga sp. E6(2014) TaxID=1495334 RepID=UPI00051D33E9|nr:hypothetical protein [Cellulophaga sp. E6(2014)]KGK29437.1 hypothetical protein EL45_15470 [Cellulophaga sp. E6(2014)]